jgi:hypothetical protein
MTPMRIRFFLVVLFVAGAAQAGPLELEPKEVAPAAPTITDDDHWYFNIGMPGWFAFLSGEIGLHGSKSDVDVDFGQIITHAAGIASISAEARKGRFGVYGDLLYMSLSAGIYNNGLIKKANLTVDSYIADGEVYYRVWESPKGWLDLRAGARYTNSFSRIELAGADAKINMAAAAFVTAANEDLRSLLERLLHGGLDPSHPPLPFPPLGPDAKLKILRLIRHARQDPMNAQHRITRILKTHLNKGYGLTEYWADPYVGIGGRYAPNKAFYLTGKVDVGGFDVGSIVTVQAYGAIGCHVTRHIYSELGFRYLYDDYDSGGYLYKVSTYGPQFTAGIEF